MLGGNTSYHLNSRQGPDYGRMMLMVLLMGDGGNVGDGDCDGDTVGDGAMLRGRILPTPRCH